MDDGPSHDDAQDDDEDLRSDPMAQVDLGVSLDVSEERLYRNSSLIPGSNISGKSSGIAMQATPMGCM